MHMHHLAHSNVTMLKMFDVGFCNCFYFKNSMILLEIAAVTRLPK